MKSLHEKRNKPTKGVNPFAKFQKKSTKDWDGDGEVESSQDEWRGAKDKAIKGAKSKAAPKKKKKIGKMRVSCQECNSDIRQVRESRIDHRIKLRGFCENCNKAKVVYVDDIVVLESQGNKFDRLIENNLPAGAPIPPNSNPKQQAPANPASTTTPPTPATPATPSTAAPGVPPAGQPPVDPVAMAAKIVQQAAALLKDPAKLIDHMQKSAEELKKAQQQPPPKPATPAQPPAAGQQPAPGQQPVK